MDGSWLKLYRSIIDTSFWHDDWLVRLWIWCLVKANYVDANWRGVLVRRGEFITGRNRAAEELGVSPSKWMRGIAKLVEYGCIEYRPDNNWTRISVCNYSTYQDDDREDRTTGDTTSDTTSGQRMTQRADTSKEGNKGRREEVFTHTHATERGAWMDHEIVRESQELQDAIRFWCATFSATHGHGRDDDDIRIDMRLAEARSKGWDAAKIAKSIRFSVTKLAKSWLDPDADFEQLTKARMSEAKRKNKDLVPVEERF